MSVRFATCNILFDDGKSEPRWNERSKNLVSLIEELKPDVLATPGGPKGPTPRVEGSHCK